MTSSILKTMLLRVPPVYEAVQTVRDSAFRRRADRAGRYSQHGEDIELLRLLSESDQHGAVVDVGCNHPFKLSNTYLLYRNGWRGLCVDPLPRYEQLYARWRPEDVFRNAAVGEAAAQMPLYEFESDVLSTLDAELAQSYVSQGYRLRRKTSISVVPLDTLIAQAGMQPPLSLLSIDIEGHELSALRSMRLSHWAPALVCLEALTGSGARNVDAIEYLLANGYGVEVDMGLNLILRRMHASHP